MTLEWFAEEVKERVEKQLGADFHVEMREDVKNNGHKVTGILVKQKGKSFGTQVFLNGLFDEYQELPEEEGLNRVVKAVMETQEKGKQETEKLLGWTAKLHDYEKIKDLIRYKLVNAEKNQELLAAVPHIPYLDLAIVFYLEMYEDPHGIASLQIEQWLLDSWEISLEELYQKAMENTPKLQPYAFVSVMEELEGVLDLPEEVNAGLKEEGKALYCLSNRNGINGAGVILYPGVMERCADMLGGDLIVLPSSIHEMLMICCGEHERFQVLAQMVREINAAAVPPETFLSDHVYRYCRAEKRMEIAA